MSCFVDARVASILVESSWIAERKPRRIGCRAMLRNQDGDRVSSEAADGCCCDLQWGLRWYMVWMNSTRSRSVMVRRAERAFSCPKIQNQHSPHSIKAASSLSTLFVPQLPIGTRDVTLGREPENTNSMSLSLP